MGLKDWISFKGLNEDTKPNGIAIGSTGGEPKGLDIFKAYIPEFLYKPPYGYPRKENIPLIKSLAKNPYVFSVIKTLCDEATSVPWKIQVKETFNEDETEYEQDIKNVTSFFENPNGNHESFEMILKQVITGILELDAGLIVKVFNQNGEFKQIFARDGSTFLKNPDIYGYMGDRADFVAPFPSEFQSIAINYNAPTEVEADFMKQYDALFRQDAAYFQYGWTAGSMPVPFGKREVIYIMQNPRPDSIYGRSPVEILQEIIQNLIYGAEFNLDFYTNNNMPEGVIQLLGADPDKIEQFRENFENQFKFTDELGKKRKKFFTFPISSSEVQFTKFQLNPQEMDVLMQQEWFTKVLWMSFGVNANEMGFTETVNKSTGEDQTKLAKRKALKPILQILKYHINTQIVPEFYAKGGEMPDFSEVPIEFTFDDYDFDEDEKEHNILEQELRMGVKTPEMVAKELNINIDELKAGMEEKRDLDMEMMEKESSLSQDKETSKEDKKPDIPKKDKVEKKSVDKTMKEIDKFIDDIGSDFAEMIETIPDSEVKPQ